MANVEGSQAPGATNSGRPPVKIGGVYNTTQPTYTNGQIVEAQFDSKGNQYTTLSDSGGIPAAITSLGDGISAGNRGILVAAQEYVFSGSGMDKQRTPTTFKIAAAATAASGTGFVVWTPQAGKKFRLMGYALSSTAAASLIFCDDLVSAPIFRTPILAASGVHTMGAGDFGNGILSGSVLRSLRIDCSAATTVTGTVWGCEE